MFHGEFAVFLATVSYVCSMEKPIITRATNDLIQFPKCDGKSADKFECSSNSDSQRVGDLRTCQCKCNPGYLAYRDPKIEFLDARFQPVAEGHAGCVWYSYYSEGCHNLHVAETISRQIQGDNHTFPFPTILDLTSSSQIILTVQDAFTDNGCFKVDPFVRIPGENSWKPVDDIDFQLRRQDGKYVLKWILSNTSPDISYAYQGLIMKLNFTQCFQSNAIVNCIMTKVAGTYTAADSGCKQRTESGRCCIFPFVHNGVEYKKCARTKDMPGGTWCAVSLDTSITNGNHKWREFCPGSSTTRSSLPTKSTKPKSKHFPTIITPHPSSKKPTPKTKPITTKPHRPTTPRASKVSVAKRPVAKITVTVTKHTCPDSSKVVPPTIGAQGSGESGGNAGAVVGIVCGILVLLVLVALLGLYLRRRKTAGKSLAKKSYSSDNLAESPYASVYGTPRHTRNQVNHGYQQSIELTEDQAAVVRRSYLRDSLNSSGGSHFYDTVTTDGSRPGTGLSCPIYSMPEADYSLIEEKSGQVKSENPLPPILPIMLSGTRNNPSSHLYSVLERDNDPLKHPEAIDNDTVFVEANPLYGTTTRRKVTLGKRESERGIAEANPLYGTTTGYRRDKPPPPLPPRLYDDPTEIAPTKNDPVGRGEADV